MVTGEMAKALGTRVRMLRRGRGWSQTQLAEHAGIAVYQTVPRTTNRRRSRTLRRTNVTPDRSIPLAVYPGRGLATLIHLYVPGYTS